VLDCRGGARIAYARLATGTLVVEPGHPLIAAVEAGVSPQERLDKAMRLALGAEYRGDIANNDLPHIHAAEMSRREQRLPRKDDRYRQYRALKRNGQHLPGVQITQGWRTLARDAGEPWADIALQLATFLRASGQPTKAIAVAQEALGDKRLGASQHETAMLATSHAGAWLDKFERKGGERADLLAARTAIGRAYAIEAERDHPEIQNVYGRLRALEDPQR